MCCTINLAIPLDWKHFEGAHCWKLFYNCIKNISLFLFLITYSNDRSAVAIAIKWTPCANSWTKISFKGAREYFEVNLLALTSPRIPAKAVDIFLRIWRYRISERPAETSCTGVPVGIGIVFQVAVFGNVGRHLLGIFCDDGDSKCMLVMRGLNSPLFTAPCWSTSLAAHLRDRPSWIWRRSKRA